MKSLDISRGSGGEAVEVDPGDLHVVGHRFTTAASDAAKEFAKHHTDLEDYSSTVFAATRTALMGKVADWRTRTAKLVQTVDSHGHTLHSSAIEYRDADSDGRQDVENAVRWA